MKLTILLSLITLVALSASSEVSTNWYSFQDDSPKFDLFGRKIPACSVQPLYGWRIGDVKSNDVWVGQINIKWTLNDDCQKVWSTNFIKPDWMKEFSVLIKSTNSTIKIPEFKSP